MIYCFTRNITYSGKTYDCPPYPFQLRSDLVWSTDDYVHSPYSDSLTVNNFFNSSAYSGVQLPSLTDSFKDSLELTRRLYDMLERQEQLESEKIAARIPILDWNIPYTSLTKVLLMFSGSVAMSLGVVLWLNERRHLSHKRRVKQQHTKMHLRLKTIQAAVAPHIAVDTDDEEENLQGPPLPRDNSTYLPNGRS